MKQLDVHGILGRIEADTARMLRTEREAVEAGPLLAAFHPTSDMIWMNYAVPIASTDDADAVRAALDRLRPEFSRRRRVLRFEYLAARHPNLAALLEQAGLARQLEAPLMICTPPDARLIEPRGFELERLAAETPTPILADFRRVGKAGFGLPEADATPDEIDELREALRLGRWRCALARCGGAAVGVGTFCTGNCELAGVATLPEFRRRGIAAAISGSLLRDHLSADGDWAWLSAGDEIARALYRRVGFQDAGVQLHYLAAADVLATPEAPDH